MAGAVVSSGTRLQGRNVQQHGVRRGGGGEAGAPAIPPARAPLRHQHGLLMQHRLDVAHVGRQVGGAAGVGNLLQQLCVALQPLRTLRIWSTGYDRDCVQDRWFYIRSTCLAGSYQVTWVQATSRFIARHVALVLAAKYHPVRSLVCYVVCAVNKANKG